MKIVHGVLALMFLAFAAVQYNDPDPFLWIFIYLSMTALCVLAFRNQFYPKVMAVLAVGFVIYAVILAPGVWDWFNSEDRSLLF
ncbi:MAG: transmembrane 220 family protein, partial [Bacteroidota bacterium]